MSRYDSSADLTPVEIAEADDLRIGAREYARRAYAHSLASHRLIGQLAREVSEMKASVRTLVEERSTWRKWRSRAANVGLGAATIIAGGAVLHFLHWGP